MTWWIGAEILILMSPTIFTPLADHSRYAFIMSSWLSSAGLFLPPFFFDRLYPSWLLNGCRRKLTTDSKAPSVPTCPTLHLPLNHPKIIHAFQRSHHRPTSQDCCLTLNSARAGQGKKICSYKFTPRLKLHLHSRAR